MSENEKEVEETMAEPENASEAAAVSNKKPVLKLYGTAAIAVAVVLLGVLYVTEKQGRSSTTLFSSIIEKQVLGEVVAEVNGTDITNGDLQNSIAQFNQLAVAQGIDSANPEVQADIRTQALDVLINTELLVQAAKERDISATGEQVAQRREGIIQQLGGEDVLQERMELLGLSDEDLMEDLEEEIIIQTLLDQVFAESDVEVSEEEISAVYASAGQEGAELPALEEVRDFLEQDLRASKEQEAIDSFLETQKTAAVISVI